MKTLILIYLKLCMRWHVSKNVHLKPRFVSSMSLTLNSMHDHSLCNSCTCQITEKISVAINLGFVLYLQFIYLFIYLFRVWLLGKGQAILLKR